MRAQMQRVDEALILRKKIYKDSHLLVTMLARNYGRVHVAAFGVRRITSRRLSHLETGNVLRVTWRDDGERATLQETELRYAHSGIKAHSDRLHMMYAALFIVNALLPDNDPAEHVYTMTLAFLRKLNAQACTRSEFNTFLTKLLMREGYVSAEESSKPQYDPVEHAESIIGKSLSFI